MIIIAEDDDDYERTLRHMVIINLMRRPRTIIEDTPWVQTRWPKPEYL